MKKLIVCSLAFFGSIPLAARTREPKEPVASKVINCSANKTFVCEIKPNADNSYTERVCHCEPKATMAPKCRKDKNKSK